MESLVSIRQAAAVLGISVRRLDQMRAGGDGPLFVTIGARILYRPSDLEAFIAAHTCAPGWSAELLNPPAAERQKPVEAQTT
jgi:hypothetical protein